MYINKVEKFDIFRVILFIFKDMSIIFNSLENFLVFIYIF